MTRIIWQFIKGKLTMKFVGEDGTVIEKDIIDAPGAAVAMGMYNLDDSIRDLLAPQ